MARQLWNRDGHPASRWILPDAWADEQRPLNQLPTTGSVFSRCGILPLLGRSETCKAGLLVS